MTSVSLAQEFRDPWNSEGSGSLTANHHFHDTLELFGKWIIIFRLQDGYWSAEPILLCPCHGASCTIYIQVVSSGYVTVTGWYLQYLNIKIRLTGEEKHGTRLSVVLWLSWLTLSDSTVLKLSRLCPPRYKGHEWISRPPDLTVNQWRCIQSNQSNGWGDTSLDTHWMGQ